MHLYCWSDMAKSKEELMEVREEDMRHERFIFPVGQGGFAGERIGNYVVAFDCGSISSTSKGKTTLKLKILGFLINCVDFCHDSDKHASMMALAAPKVEKSWEFLIENLGNF